MFCQWGGGRPNTHLRAAGPRRVRHGDGVHGGHRGAHPLRPIAPAATTTTTTTTPVMGLPQVHGGGQQGRLPRNAPLRVARDRSGVLAAGSGTPSQPPQGPCHASGWAEHSPHVTAAAPTPYFDNHTHTPRAAGGRATDVWATQCRRPCAPHGVNDVLHHRGWGACRLGFAVKGGTAARAAVPKGLCG